MLYNFPALDMKRSVQQQTKGAQLKINKSCDCMDTWPPLTCANCSSQARYSSWCPASSRAHSPAFAAPAHACAVMQLHIMTRGVCNRGWEACHAGRNPHASLTNRSTQVMLSLVNQHTAARQAAMLARPHRPSSSAAGAALHEQELQ